MSDDLDALRRSWVRSLRAANKAKDTIEGYDNSARQFVAFLRSPRAVALDGEEETPAQLLERMPVTTEDTVHRDHIAAFIAEVLRQWKPATAVARHAHLRVWFAWMVEQPDIDVHLHPMTGLKQPFLPEEPPPLLRPEQIKALLGTCKQKTFVDLRDEAIMRLLADTGMRCGELAGLMAVEIIDDKRVPFVDLDVEHVYVAGKGRRPRMISFGAKTAVALDRYERARRKHPHAKSPYYWLLAQHRRTASPLSDDGIRKMLRVRGRQVGIEHVHPHQLRHAWADAQKRAGLERSAFKNQGGWRSDKMPDRYGAAGDTDRALDQHKRTSFGDQL